MDRVPNRDDDVSPYYFLNFSSKSPSALHPLLDFTLTQSSEILKWVHSSNKKAFRLPKLDLVMATRRVLTPLDCKGSAQGLHRYMNGQSSGTRHLR